MSETKIDTVVTGDEEEVSLRGFFLQALLWLPMMFFLWFTLRSVVVYPVTRLVKVTLEGWMPDLVGGIGQEFHRITYSLLVRIEGVPGLPSGQLVIEEQYANVLMYCYGLPLLFGLIMATPLTWRRTFMQMGVGYLVLLPVQVFGIFGEVLRTLAFGAGPAVQVGLAESGYAAQAAAAGQSAANYVHATLAAKGFSLDGIALIYQFGYLILPAVIPVAIWIAFNRRFIEGILLIREPAVGAAGRSTTTPDAAPPPPARPSGEETQS